MGESSAAVYTVSIGPGEFSVIYTSDVLIEISVFRTESLHPDHAAKRIFFGLSSSMGVVSFLSIAGVS